MSTGEFAAVDHSIEHHVCSPGREVRALFGITVLSGISLWALFGGGWFGVFAGAGVLGLLMVLGSAIGRATC